MYIYIYIYTYIYGIRGFVSEAVKVGRPELSA